MRLVQLQDVVEAAEQGDATAQYRLGRIYHFGKGMPKDYAEAMRWYSKAAEQGYAIAQYNVGLMHAAGQGVPVDYAESVKWFRKAAEQGNADAQSILSGMYYQLD